MIARVYARTVPMMTDVSRRGNENECPTAETKKGKKWKLGEGCRPGRHRYPPSRPLAVNRCCSKALHARPLPELSSSEHRSLH
jgi:hypothetical protein